MVTGAAIDVLLAANLALAAFMTGVIWFVQIVHYPLLARVGADASIDYQRQHMERTGWVVGLPMVLEFAVAVAVVMLHGGRWAVLNDFDEMPTFSYGEEPLRVLSARALAPLVSVWLLAIGLFVVGSGRYRRYRVA